LRFMGLASRGLLNRVLPANENIRAAATFITLLVREGNASGHSARQCGGADRGL
jgi:hypothetical protein